MKPRSLLLLLCLGGCSHGASVVDTLPDTVDLGGDTDSHPASDVVMRAESMIANDRVADAVPLLESAVRDHPNDARAFFTLGIARSLLSDGAGAEAALRSALDLDPRYPEAWNELGLLFRDGSRLEDATMALRRAVESRPTFAEAWYNLALTLEDAGDLEGAEDAYSHALEGLGNDPIVRLHHAGLAFRRADRTRGLAELRRARELASGQVDVLRAIGRTFTQLGEAAEAADTLVTAVNADRQPSLDLLIEAAAAARSARRRDLAVGMARRAAELYPVSARAFAMLALVEHEAGHATEARAALERAVRVDTEGAMADDLARLRAYIETPPPAP